MLDEKIENVCTQFQFCHYYSIRRISEFPIAKNSWFKIFAFKKSALKMVAIGILQFMLLKDYTS
jgi:hypothetical protein